jgi:hypothetical protein
MSERLSKPYIEKREYSEGDPVVCETEIMGVEEWERQYSVGKIAKYDPSGPQYLFGDIPYCIRCFGFILVQKSHLNISSDYVHNPSKDELKQPIQIDSVLGIVENPESINNSNVLRYLSEVSKFRFFQRLEN